jgi:beta-glucanase (GH16 family)
MKPTILYLLLFVSHSFISCSPQTNPPRTLNDGYKYLWGDEFNQDGRPDSQKWDYEKGFIRNNEAQWYQPENAFIKDGYLVIEARKEQIVNPNYDPESKSWPKNQQHAYYTSACLITKGKFEFKYGRVLMRSKINTAPGQWPAFWMLGVNIDQVSWPACGEVDIMEFYRKTLFANAAWEGEKKVNWDDVKFPANELGDENWWNEFHEWRMDWDENKIDIFLDDRLLNSIDLTETVNFKIGNNPFQEPFYLLLNLALGQNFEHIPDETIPSRLEVDYVRVYQKY